MALNRTISKLCGWVACLVVLLVIAPLLAHAKSFKESWESLPFGFVQPDALGRFQADSGTWVAGDTVSEFPECGPTPHTGEIILKNGKRALRLTSNNSHSECADNLWIEFRAFPPLNINPGFTVPLDADSVLTFEESGFLVNPGPIGAPTCVVPPCGDNISLTLEDNRGFVLTYVLQRAPGQEPKPVPSWLIGIYKEIFLDPDAETYARNLLDDFATIPGYNPSGAKVDHIIFRIDEHGTATIDNIAIGAGSPPPDRDGDGIPDDMDNCPSDPNSRQTDTDEDGRGDVCDLDDDNDGLSDDEEKTVHRTDPKLADTDGDGVNDGDEVAADTNPLVNEPAVLMIINAILAGED